MPEDLPEPSDADLAEVRRLLRAARNDEPIPADVVARLDETLASLNAERAAAAGMDATAVTGSEERPGATGVWATSATAPSLPAARGESDRPDQSEPAAAPRDVRGGVVQAEATSDADPTPALDELAARRARRRKVVRGAGLVAAAAVVAAGFLGQLVTNDDSDSSTAGGDSTGEVADEAANDDPMPEAAAPTTSPHYLEKEADESGATFDRLPLTPDEQRAVNYVLDQLSEDESAAYRGRTLTRLDATATLRCGSWSSRATLVEVPRDGDDLLLALEPRRADGSRDVHLLDCGRDVERAGVERSIEVPALD